MGLIFVFCGAVEFFREMNLEMGKIRDKSLSFLGDGLRNLGGFLCLGMDGGVDGVAQAFDI